MHRPSRFQSDELGNSIQFSCLADVITLKNCTWLQVAPQLGHLGLPGSPIGVFGLAALAGLSSLRSLSVCVSPNAPHSLTAITHLSHLTALQVSTTQQQLVQ